MPLRAPAALAAATLAWAAAASAAGGGLRGAAGSHMVDQATGELRGDLALHRRYDLGRPPQELFDIQVVPDQHLTHSCSNYVNDGSTVYSRGHELVLKVASHCAGGGCLNSGRIMSKESYTYGLFIFTARVPKCNYVWPAIWLLPGDVNGTGAYGTWPCSGEIDLMETVHDEATGTFNLVAGYGTESMGCQPQTRISCNRCDKTYCTSSTMNPSVTLNPYFVEPVKDCSGGGRQSWRQHTFVLSWQPDEVTAWVDPTMEWDGRGRLVKVAPKPAGPEAKGMATWRTYPRQSTPSWTATEQYMQMCFPGQASRSAPFDRGFKLMLNVAVGGYGAAPCRWGQGACQSACGGAVGAELVVSDISIWQQAR